MVQNQNCIKWIETHNTYIHTKTNDIYKNIAEDVETRFDTSNYDKIDHFLKEKRKK